MNLCSSVNVNEIKSHKNKKLQQIKFYYTLKYTHTHIKFENLRKFTSSFTFLCITKVCKMNDYLKSRSEKCHPFICL